MKGGRKIEELLQRKGEELEIPKKLEPERMQKVLEEYEGNRGAKQQFFKKRRYPVLASAACFLLAVGILLPVWQAGSFSSGEGAVQTEPGKLETAQNRIPSGTPKEEQELLELPNQSYEEIYACLSEYWKTCADMTGASAREDMNFTEAIKEPEMEDAAGGEQKLLASESAFGRTNTQVAQVDEADRIKNDGRYLYQIATKQPDGADTSSTGIQILDTGDGLAETAFVDGFESLEEFYVWNDLLLTIENKYYDDASPLTASRKGAYVEDAAVCGSLSLEQGYHEISIYQIADRSHPRKLKTFTLQGRYESSRISEGYFYGISRFTAEPGEGAQDYDAYIPSIDGKRMEADRICCPSDADGADYLVLVSIDLSDPSSFTDSRAVLAGSGTYYVSTGNIYVAQYRPVWQTELQKEGSVKDTTQLLRFSYRNGRFYAQAEGEVPGNVESSFSMDEYEGNLRMAVTVQEYNAKEIRDDRTGERLGFDYGEAKETSALYILSPSLTVKGKIEGLAEGETIRSARLLGKTGYFVTFRQTDPLFAVDLSDPEHPQVLGELKVSGFSEYLHIYGENRLLGIGMEAEEATGQEQGMKLSMFDTSDPTELKEVSRLRLEGYDYSEALWDHRAVLVDTEENIIGFMAEGWRKKEHQMDYFLFSYEEGAFVQTLKADARLEDSGYVRSRGTFIGNVFYLLFENGTVRAYDRETGELLEELPAS